METVIIVAVSLIVVGLIFALGFWAGARVKEAEIASLREQLGDSISVDGSDVYDPRKDNWRSDVL